MTVDARRKTGRPRRRTVEYVEGAGWLATQQTLSYLASQ